MKVFIIISIILFASSASLRLSLVRAQEKQSPLTEMVQAEQAFSKTAEVKTTRDAFMEFIADDGLLFRPGAVNGKKWMQEHPVPASSKRGLLAWQPTFAGMSASGDFGFTTGPWEAKTEINDEKPSAFGHFVTVWKKQSDGSWKFAVDLGISHPAAVGSQTILMATDVTTTGAVTMVDVEAERRLLLADDRKLAKESKNGSTAFFARAEPGVRVYRNNYPPQIGKLAGEKILIPANSQMKWKPLDSDVAKSGDVGYTRGTYDVLDAKKKVVEHGSYVRIWRKHGPSWKIVIDVTNPH